MSWQKTFIDKAGDILRFIGYAFLAVDAIVLAAFTFWFIAKFVWNFMSFLNRVMFGRPW